jgi:anti-anti-sigma factor
MVKSFAIMINLPKSLGSKEAKKMVRELKTEIKHEPPGVILDLSRVKTMGCAGLHGLLVCMQEIARYDCAIQLRAVSPEAATLLELVRMDYLFQKFPSLPAPAPGFTIAPASVAEEVKPEIMVQLQPVAA